MLRSLIISSLSLIFSQLWLSSSPIFADNVTNKIANGAIFALQNDQRLSEEKVRNILAKMVIANQQKNANGVTEFMADFVTTNNRFITAKEILNTKVYGKTQHLFDLEGEYAGTSSYNYHGYRVKIDVSPDRQYAIAQENYLLVVKLPTNERVLFAIASRTKFSLINGEAKIFAINSTVEMENPPAFATRAY